MNSIIFPLEEADIGSMEASSNKEEEGDRCE